MFNSHISHIGWIQHKKNKQWSNMCTYQSQFIALYVSVPAHASCTNTILLCIAYRTIPSNTNTHICSFWYFHIKLRKKLESRLQQGCSWSIELNFSSIQLKIYADLHLILNIIFTIKSNFWWYENLPFRNERSMERLWSFCLIEC